MIAVQCSLLRDISSPYWLAIPGLLRMIRYFGWLRAYHTNKLRVVTLSSAITGASCAFSLGAASGEASRRQGSMCTFHPTAPARPFTNSLHLLPNTLRSRRTTLAQSCFTPVFPLFSGRTTWLGGHSRNGVVTKQLATASAPAWPGSTCQRRSAAQRQAAVVRALSQIQTRLQPRDALFAVLASPAGRPVCLSPESLVKGQSRQQDQILSHQLSSAPL